MLTLAFFCLFLNENLHAQNDEPGFAVVEYMKVKPGMMEEYRECEKVWKTIHQARIKAGYITGWQIEKVMYPSGTDAEYDFVVSTIYKDWKAIDAENGETFAALFKAMPEEERAIANNASEYRDIVKREIWTAEEMIFAPGSTRPKYIVENFMSIPIGGWNKWLEMETTFAKPFILKSMEMGNRAGWLIGNMIFPRGREYPYQASTVDYYHSWEDMSINESEIWKIVHGNISSEEIGARIGSVRTVVRSEVRYLLDYVE